MEKLTSEFKIEYIKGDTYALAIKFKNITEDLRTAYLSVKENPDDIPLIQKSLGAGIEKIDDRAYKNEKTYKFQLQPADTVNLEAKVQYLYDIQVTVGNVVKTVLHGVFILGSTITGTSGVTTQEMEVAIDDELEIDAYITPSTTGIEYEQDPVASAMIGVLSTLETGNKESVVKAINEINKTATDLRDGVTVIKKSTEVLNKINGKEISDIFEADGVTAKKSTNATKSTYANYASEDLTKGTIEERLTNLGFREGVVESLVTTASANFLKRQGNYVIGTLDLGDNFFQYNKDGNIVIGVLPTEFRPKQDEYAFVPFSEALFNAGSFQNYFYGVLQIKISTSGEITLYDFICGSYCSYINGTYSKNDTTSITLSNLSGTMIYGLKIQFGYEAEPLG